MRKNTINLTKSTIVNLPPADPGRRDCYYDSKVDGLELRVTDKGSKSFSVYRWVNGKARRIVLGRFSPTAMQGSEFEKDPLSVMGNNPILSVENARKLAAAVLIDLTAGNEPLESRRHSDVITLGELFRQYIDNYAMEHTKTWKVMEECFDRYLSHWKGKEVVSIKRSHVQQLINKLGNERGKTTANRTLQLLRAVINKGIQWSLVEGDNPATGIAMYKLKPRKRFIAEHELPKLIAAIEEDESQDIRDYIHLSLYTGARKMNILSMRWRDVDLEGGVWTIPDTKNDESQEILLTEPELEILRRRYNQRDRSKESFQYVFPGPGSKGHLTDPKKGWHRILRRAGIEDLHLHDLRRTLGTYMAMSGVSLSVIGNALNHKDLATTRKVYAQSAREAEKQARKLAHKRMFSPEKQSNIVELDERRDKEVEF